MDYSLIDFFSHPVLRAATLGSLFVGVSSALVGSILLVQRRSLLGEALSHAAYPGLLLAPFLLGVLPFIPRAALPVVALIGAFVFTGGGFHAVSQCERKLRMSSDAALSLVSALFLGLGVTMASRVQFAYPLESQRLQTLLYGQVATMTEKEGALYACFAVVCACFIIVYFRQLEMALFDRACALQRGEPGRLMHTLFVAMLLLTVVFGAKTVGIVLLSGMLIAPAVAARQLTDRLGRLMIFAACLGALSTLSGHLLALYLPLWLGREVALPTGPMMVLVATALCGLALFFAPKRGVVVRLVRIISFRFHCLRENLIKALWKARKPLPLMTLRGLIGAEGGLGLRWHVRQLIRQGWVVREEKDTYRLTSLGAKKAAQLVRLHRLWELYLTSELHIHQDRVHRSAEEMEHILTPEIERKLTHLLNNPQTDPHSQPIPQWEDLQC